MTPTCGICIAARALRHTCSLFLAGPQPLWPGLLAEGEHSRPLMAPPTQQGLTLLCTDPTPV